MSGQFTRLTDESGKVVAWMFTDADGWICGFAFRESSKSVASITRYGGYRNHDCVAEAKWWIRESYE